MSWVDYAIMMVLVYFVFKGMRQGLLRAVFSLALFALATWAGLRYNRAFAVFLKPSAHYLPAEIIASFIILFFLTLIAGLLLRYLLGKFVQTSGLSLSNRLTGMLCGVAHGLITLTFMVMLAGLTPLPKSHWWWDSSLLPRFQILAHWLKRQSASDLTNLIHYH